MTTYDSAPPMGFDPVISRPKAAEYLGLSLRSLDALFARGGGPVRTDTLDGRCGYRLSALNAWLEGRARTSSADATVQRAAAARAAKPKPAKAKRTTEHSGRELSP